MGTNPCTGRTVRPALPDAWVGCAIHDVLPGTPTAIADPAWWMPRCPYSGDHSGHALGMAWALIGGSGSGLSRGHTQPGGWFRWTGVWERRSTLLTERFAIRDLRCQRGIRSLDQRKAAMPGAYTHTNPQGKIVGEAEDGGTAWACGADRVRHGRTDGGGTPLLLLGYRRLLRLAIRTGAARGLRFRHFLRRGKRGSPHNRPGGGGG